jgi:hypothetical protein
MQAVVCWVRQGPRGGSFWVESELGRMSGVRESIVVAENIFSEWAKEMAVGITWLPGVWVSSPPEDTICAHKRQFLRGGAA